MSVREFFGGMFLAIGWLIATLSGGCTVVFSAFFIFGVLFGNGRHNDIEGFLGIVLPVGGIPLLVGVIIIWIGRLVKGNKKPHSVGSNPYATPEEMRKNEKRHLKGNLKKDNPFIDEEN